MFYQNKFFCLCIMVSHQPTFMIVLFLNNLFHIILQTKNFENLNYFSGQQIWIHGRLLPGAQCGAKEKFSLQK